MLSRNVVPATLRPPALATSVRRQRAFKVGQAVTYIDATGARHTATILEPYGYGALIACDLGNRTAKRLQFEDATPPYITDADGTTTEASFEAPIAEE